MRQKARRGLAFVLTLIMLWHSGAFVCFAEEIAQSVPESEAPVPGTAIRAGDHVRLGASQVSGSSDTGFAGYDFTVLNTELNGEGLTEAAAKTAEAFQEPQDKDMQKESGGISGGADKALLLLSDPKGLEGSLQQFDEAVEALDGGHPDEDSRLDGYSLWTESDLYIALNGAASSGSTAVHGAEVWAAQRFYQRLSANGDEWTALLPNTEDGSDGEKVSLLSETAYETFRGDLGTEFWYTGTEENGFWLKTARPGYTNQVRYIYSGNIPPSLSAEAYYALARDKRAVRPALLLDLRRVVFGAGSGAEEDPYRELSLRPPVKLTLNIIGWNPQTAAEAVLSGGAVSGAAVQIASTTAAGMGRCTQVITVGGISAGAELALRVGKPAHIEYREEDICLMEDTELTVRLSCGDVNGDGSIDLEDRLILLSFNSWADVREMVSAAEEKRLESLKNDGLESCTAASPGNCGADYRADYGAGLAADGTIQAFPDLDGDRTVGFTDLYILMLNDNFGKRVRVQ